MVDLKAIDKNMAVKDPKLAGITWYSPLNKQMFKAYGSDAFYEGDYARLSRKQRELIKPVSDALEYLSMHCAGIQLKFATNSTRILIDVSLLAAHNMHNMAATAQTSFDIYVFDESKGEYVFHNTGCYPREQENYQIELSLFHYFDKTLKKRKYIINFPLYQGLKSLKIGLDSEAICEPISFNNKGKIVLYGTSIAQGGCVSRPGLAYSNILSRWLDMEICNQGYSGSALLEAPMGYFMGEITNQKLLIIDAEANAGCDDKMETRLEQFINEYKKNQENIPILLVTRSLFAFDRFDQKRISLRQFYKKFTLEMIEKFKSKGYPMFFLDGDDYFDGFDLDFTEFTVDGVHPNDFGSYLMAKKHLKVIKEILN